MSHSFIRVKYHTSCEKTKTLVKLEKMKIFRIKEDEKGTNLILVKYLFSEGSRLKIFSFHKKKEYLRHSKPGKAFVIPL